MFRFFRKSAGEGQNGSSLWAVLLLEMSAIIIAVMLGFWVNEWREGRQKQAQLEEAKFRIAAELNYNHQRMVMLYAYYDDIISRIEKRIAEDPDFRPLEAYAYQIEGFRGAMPPLLRSSTFHMLLNTGILTAFDVQTADDIALLYNMQSIIETLDKAILSNVSDDSGFTRIPTIRHMFGLFKELIPIVLAGYEVYGIEHFGAYGFDNRIEHPQLRNAVDMQKQGF
ncbi:MAG: hypothetical protein JJU35_11835 [Balneolales bacterium]|nr:hypothetical protein [Balneolales bacterium]